jgi:PAS domain S-box-containing protein
VVQLDGTIVAANPAWTDILDWEARDLIGTNCLALAHPDDTVEAQDELRKLARGITMRGFETRVRHKDGSYRDISWTAVPDEHFIHAVGRDISAEKSAELMLKETEARLRQSQKMEALGQLTGGIAHDFNNLLQGITGSLDAVRRRVSSGSNDVERFIETATSSASRAAALIHRLLAFSRQQSLDNQKVDINRLVSSMEELLRRTLGPELGLNVTVSKDVWLVLSDENQLESAILNLAINARDAMPNGGTLSISTANVTLDESEARHYEGLKPGDYARITVADTGTGMPPDVLAKAFDPFFTTKPIGQGTGLGLSMIYGFAKQSEGHVRLESELGKGTSVSLYLPRHHTATEAVAAVELEHDMPAGEGETVLVLDDEPIVRMLIVEELELLGYSTLEAGESGEALPLLKSGRKIDLLLSDVGLPGMNGRQVAEIARQFRPALPVLFMTGYAEGALARSQFLGPNMQMMTKPFQMDELAKRIRDILAP